jgi:hypothetical protein
MDVRSTASRSGRRSEVELDDELSDYDDYDDDFYDDRRRRRSGGAGRAGAGPRRRAGGRGAGRGARGRGRSRDGRDARERSWSWMPRKASPGGNGDPDDPQRTIPTRPNAQIAARVGLWFLVALGAFGGCVGLLRPSSPAPTGTAADAAADVVPADTAGFAQLAVTTWVQASGEEDEDALDELFAVNPSTNGSDAGRRRVSGSTYVVGARLVDDGYWAVTVATPVQEMVAERWESGGTWYLEVGIAETTEGLIAVTEPALVSAPAEPEEPPRPAGGGLGVPSVDDEDMATTVEGFLNALVAGDGDVSRYLAPDIVITPVTPAPFAEISLQRWGLTQLSEGRVRARVEARAQSANGVPRTVSYELGLAERAGRWEVTSLSGAPALDPETTVPADGAGSGASGGSGSDAPSPAPTADQVTTTVSIASEPGA